jgi:hypothetical protein
MAKRLFERADSDSDRVFLPMHIYGGGVFTSGVRTQSINIGGRNIDNLFSDRRLSRMVENEVVDAFLNLPSAQVILATQFDMPREKIWCLVRAERRTMLPLSPVGEIGEFDIIVGRIIDDYVDLSTLGLVECKLAKTQASATEHSTKMPKYSSGWGTTQLGAARGLGFDFLLAAHFLVRPPSEVPDQSWSSAADAANFRREAERLHGMMEARETNPFYGVVAIGWGHVVGADPRISGALTPMQLWKSPRLERPNNRCRADIERALRQLIPERRPAARFFRFCERCRTAVVFASDDASRLRCDACRR